MLTRLLLSCITTVCLIVSALMLLCSDTAREEARHLFVNPGNITVGATIDVYGRPLRVRAADPWTRAWYASAEAAAEYGVEPQPPNVVEVDVPVPRAAYVPPPHTGFGSEEDSLASCLTIDVKPRRKDCTQWATWDGVVHRITACERCADIEGRQWSLTCSELRYGACSRDCTWPIPT